MRTVLAAPTWIWTTGGRRERDTRLWRLLPRILPNSDDVAGVDPEALAIRGQLEPRQGPRAAARGVLQLLGHLVELAPDLERLAGRE
jgi:hypothetical protein